MANYPEEYELDIVLRDGGVARVRPIKPKDGDALRNLFSMMSARSRYFRFFGVKDSLSNDEIEYFVNVDYESRMAFVAQVDEIIVAVGRYERTKDTPTAAEVAFAIADDYQQRGIGTQLLQLLTVYARSEGMDQFRAFVLPENMQMMRVFRSSGFEMHRTLEEGVYNVDFPVELTSSAFEAEQEREKLAVAKSLLPIFIPRSVAVVGASRTPGSIGNRLFRNLFRADFAGVVYPVNPTAETVNSVRAYPTVLDVPDPIDLAVIVVPAKHVKQVIEECAEKGVRGLVVISAGFSEVGGAGAELEDEVLAMVRDAGMRMVGPNCMGVLNTDIAVKLDATFAPSFPPAGNVAMSSQSGALGIAILDYATRNNLGISTFVSVGNKADISGNDLLLYWEDDPATDVIVLYLESFGNPRRFGRLARRIARKKPIVAVKSGRTQSGSRAASSHTGALASLDVAVDALFRQSGVIRTTTLEELFDVTGLLASQPLPTGRRVAVVTNAGGPGILAADAIEANGLQLPEFSQNLQDQLRAGLPAEAATRNPVDLIASAGPEQYDHCLDILLESDEIDAVIGIYIPTTEEGGGEVARAVRDVAARHAGSKTMMAVVMQPDGVGTALTTENFTIPAFQFPEDAALALARAAKYAEWRERPLGAEASFDDVDAPAIRATIESALVRLGADGGWLDPIEVDSILGSLGLTIPKGGVVTSVEEAVSMAAGIGGPAVLKVISPSALHKSDVGGIVLNVEGETAVIEAYEQVASSVPDPEGVLVQEMVDGGHEVLVGMTTDPNFGPLIVFGLGGVFVELLGDVAFRIHPLSDLDAAEMVREIKTAQLLQGFRGLPEGDLAAVEETLLRVSQLVEIVPELEEMDLNPVLVLEPGSGAVAVDARMRIEPRTEGWSPELVDLPAVIT